MQIEWFVFHKNSILGPFSTEDVKAQISSQKIAQDAFIWWKGEKDWVAIDVWLKDYPAIIKKLEAHFKVRWKIRDEHGETPFMSFEDSIQHLKLLELRNTIFICKEDKDGVEQWESIFSNTIFLNALEMTRRKHPRVPIVATAKVSKKDSKFSYLVKVNIIGQGGMGVSGLGRNFPAGTTVEVRLESPNISVPVVAEGRILYMTKDGLSGIEFGLINSESEAALIEYVNQFINTRKTTSSEREAA
ncbi:MAG: PilZ domain-containing protein [Bdellovibrionaceae bacterium]|nr:PilZ domain-containing protein [Pseudobdellovibrionaceae bacterium]